MSVLDDERKAKIDEARKNLADLSLAIDRLKALGIDTTSLDGTYSYLKTQVELLSQV